MSEHRYKNKLEAVIEDINGYRLADGQQVLSLNKLAEQVGMTRQALSSIFKELSIPSYQNAIRIHKTLSELMPANQKMIALTDLFPVPEKEQEPEIRWQLPVN